MIFYSIYSLQVLTAKPVGLMSGYSTQLGWQEVYSCLSNKENWHTHIDEERGLPGEENKSAQSNLGRGPRRGAVAHVRRKVPIVQNGEWRAPNSPPKVPLPVDRSPNLTTCLIPRLVRFMMPNGIRIWSPSSFPSGSLPLPLKRGSGDVTLRKMFEILHCCRLVLAHFETQNVEWLGEMLGVVRRFARLGGFSPT